MTAAVIPHHIAIVMDGNGRWAKRRFLPRLAGHKQGVDALRRCAKACAERGVKVLTVFAFSSENWNRPTDEVDGLMNLLARVAPTPPEQVRQTFADCAAALEIALSRAEKLHEALHNAAHSPETIAASWPLSHAASPKIVSASGTFQSPESGDSSKSSGGASSKTYYKFKM